MVQKEEIKSRIEADSFGSILFEEKSFYLENNDYVAYEKCSLQDFMENIFGSAYNYDAKADVFPFEEEQCDEYINWREQANENGFKDIVYQPDQNFKYNALWLALCRKPDRSGKGVVLKGYPFVMTTGLEQAEKALKKNYEALISSPITYVGKSRTSANSRYLYALAFDLDGVGMQNLRDLTFQMMNGVIPTANIIVNSGNGLHLYYIFKKPIALFQNAKRVLGVLKKELTIRIWNQYTSEIKKRQFQGIFQGFRVPGSRTKRGETVQAFINRDCPLYTVEDLCKGWISDGSKGSIITKEEWEPLDNGVYTTDRNTLKKAKANWPEWYERVIVRGDKSKGRYTTHRGLYDWWLARLKDPVEPVSEGHRYFCLLALSMYAIKCNIEFEELERDVFSLVPVMDRLTENYNNPFTRDDAEDALKAYHEDYCTFPKNSIEYLTGLPMPKRKRNWQKQSDHLEEARAIRDVRMKREGREWWNPNGRPKGSVITAENSPQYAKVQEWRKNNPKSTNKSLCARETGLSRPTVGKWWESR